MKKVLATVGSIIGVGAGGFVIWKVVIPFITTVFSTMFSFPIG